MKEGWELNSVSAFEGNLLLFSPVSHSGCNLLRLKKVEEEKLLTNNSKWRSQ
jgi:hypothetical protein